MNTRTGIVIVVTGAAVGIVVAVVLFNRPRTQPRAPLAGGAQPPLTSNESASVVRQQPVKPQSAPGVPVGAAARTNSPGQRVVRRPRPVNRTLIDEKKPGWKVVRKSVVDMASKDPRAAAEWAIGHVPAGGDRSFALREIMSRWAAVDPKAALGWAKALPAGSGRDSALRAVFQAWAASDPAAAAAGLGQVDDFATKNVTAGMVAYYWARKDLKAALAWAWKLPEGPGRTYALSNIIRQININERLAAQAAGTPVSAQPVQGERRTGDSAIRTLTAMLQAETPGITVESVAALLPGGSVLSPALQIRVADWARKDAESATAWAGQVAGDREQEKAKATVAAVTSPTATSQGNAAGGSTTEPSSTGGGSGQQQAADVVPADILAQDRSVAVNLAEQLPDGSMRDGVIGTIALEWGKEDPQAAVAWVVEQLQPGPLTDATVRAILWDWTSRDAVAAEEWAVALTDPAKRELAVAGVAMALARKDLAAAARVADAIPAGDKKFSVISNIAFQWGRLDVGAASAWAVGLTPDGGRDYALIQVAALKTGTDMDGALAWAQTLPAGGARDSALGGVAYAAAGQNLQQSQAIVQSLPEGPGRERAVPAIVAGLVRINPDNASAWLATLPAGRSTDLARGMFADMTVSSQPAGACQQAVSIQDATIRAVALDRCIGSWASVDPSGAKTWVTESALSSAEKERLLGSM